MIAKLVEFLGGTFFKGLAEVFLGWLGEIRKEKNLQELGAAKAKIEGLERAEHEEQVAHDAGIIATHLGDDQLRDDDGFRRD